MAEGCPFLDGVRQAVREELGRLLGDREAQVGGGGGPLLLTPLEAAQELACSRSQVYTLLNQQQLASVRVGSSVRVLRASVEEYVRRQVEGAPVADTDAEPLPQLRRATYRPGGRPMRRPDVGGSHV